MSSPYPGNPSPQQPQGGGPQGGSQPSGGDQWSSAPPPPAPGNGYPGAAAGVPAGPGQGPGSASGAPYPGPGATPPQKKKPWVWVVAVCGCLSLLALLLAGGGFALFAMGGDDDPTVGPTSSEATTEEETSEEATTEEETSEEATTEEETSEEATTEEETSAAGLPGKSGYEDTPVQDPTDADLEGAKETILAYLQALSDNDPAAACAKQLDPLTGVGIDSSSALYDPCIEGTQENIDEEDLAGSVTGLSTADFEAELDAANRVILVHNIHSGTSTQISIAKGSDGQLYVAL